MKPFMRVAAVWIACCIVTSAHAENSNKYYGSVREVFNLYSECSHSEGLTPCLKLKALSMIDRVSRMEKIELFDGVVISGKTEEVANQPSLEEEEKTLPRALDAKNQALTSMIFNRIAKMIGSKSIEVSVPKLIASARGKDDEDSKFGDIGDLFGGGEGGGHGGGHGGGGGGGHGGGGGGGGGGKSKMKKKGGGHDMKDFLMMVMAHKLALIPLFIAGLFLLAIKALTQAKIALLIAGIIFAKKIIANRNQGHVEHVQASGWSGGSSGGWAGSSGGGGGGGWTGGSSGGGWQGGWDRRSLDAQKLAYNGQKQ